MKKISKQNDIRLTGWGQVFQPFLKAGNLKKLNFIIKGDSALVDDRAKGGRSTRTFFEEGRWAEVYQSLQKDEMPANCMI